MIRKADGVDEIYIQN